MGRVQLKPKRALLSCGPSASAQRARVESGRANGRLAERASRPNQSPCGACSLADSTESPSGAGTAWPTESLGHRESGPSKMACRARFIDSGHFLRSFPEPKLYHLFPKSSRSYPPCGSLIGAQTSGGDSFETLKTPIKEGRDFLLFVHKKPTFLVTLSLSL